MRENDGLRRSSYSGPLFLSVQEGSKLPFLLAMPYELLDERFIVKCPFNILRLVTTMNKNAERPQEGTYVGQSRLFELVFYRGLDRKRVLDAPFPRAG